MLTRDVPREAALAIDAADELVDVDDVDVLLSPSAADSDEPECRADPLILLASGH